MNIIVVGGGAAGMMAAGRAAELGVRVLLVEKTSRLGTKLLMTGGGRCNITNNADAKEFMAAYGKNGKFLSCALKALPNRGLIKFFNDYNMKMNIEDDGRIFPITNRADSIVAVLKHYLEKNKVHIQYNTRVTELVVHCQKVMGVKTADGSIIKAGKVVIATGGKSYSKTGSTGDGYVLAKECGHSIISLRPGLVPLESDAEFIQRLQGITLKNVLLSVIVNGKKKKELCGELLFTHFGVSGPNILILSNMIVDALQEGNKVELSLNLKPEFAPADFDLYLQRELSAHGKKTISGFLKKELPDSLAEAFTQLAGITSAKKCGIITRDERKKLVALFTAFRIPITKARPIEEATVTRGGVSLKEINPQSMESRLVGGLFFCGEVIDVDGITGGFNLQEAFSTGYLAGQEAGKMTEEKSQ